MDASHSVMMPFGLIVTIGPILHIPFSLSNLLFLPTYVMNGFNGLKGTVSFSSKLTAYPSLNSFCFVFL